MALGVQIKTGEDPPTGEIKISGYDKKNQRMEEKALRMNAMDNMERKPNKEQELNSRLMEIAGQGQKPVRPEFTHQNSLRDEKENRDDNKRSDRNKFEIEKPERPPFERSYGAPVSPCYYLCTCNLKLVFSI